MGKISPVSAKYIIHATITIDGVVDKPDVIGAIFGQTEGLLGSELELRELQRSGRIGRIEVNVDTRSGKTNGQIIIPSSLDKAETALVGAALEIIQRIGPCNAKIHVESIEDVRITKRIFVIERAKELLKALMDGVMPDSQELTDEVTYSVRVMEIQEYGRDRLPAGPAVDESDEVIVVEGRADVLNLLKHGFKNVIGMNGTSVPETVLELSRKKVITAFVDGDRGGDLIIKELLTLGDIDYVTKAPDGKEVEELAKKEIHKCLRSRFSGEQAKMDLPAKPQEMSPDEVARQNHLIMQRKLGREREQRDGSRDGLREAPQREAPQREQPSPRGPPVRETVRPAPEPRVERQPEQRNDRQMTPDKAKAFRGMLEDLIGTRGAYVLDEKLTVLGKVPITELQATLKSVATAYAVVFDGIIERELVKAAEKSSVKFLVAMDSKVNKSETPLGLVTINEL